MFLDLNKTNNKKIENRIIVKKKKNYIIEIYISNSNKIIGIIQKNYTQYSMWLLTYIKKHSVVISKTHLHAKRQYYLRANRRKQAKKQIAYNIKIIKFT